MTGPPLPPFLGDEPEQPSEVRKASAHEMRLRDEATLKAAEKAIAAAKETAEKQTALAVEDAVAKARWDSVKVLITSGALVVGTAFTVFFAIRSDAKDIADAGVKQSEKAMHDHEVLEAAKYALIKEQLADLKDDNKDLKAKVDALLNRFNVRDPAPEPKDTKDNGKKEIKK